MRLSNLAKMTKTTITKRSQRAYQGKINRLAKKNLETILLERFLNHYGFEKGPVVAKALIKDLLKLVNEFYIKADTLQPGQLVWLAADKDERAGRGKTLDNTKKRTIKLTLFSPDDLNLLKNSYTNFRDIQNRRVIRFIKEAYQQDAVLTSEDLLILLALDEAYITDWIKAYQNKTGQILPTRGNIADIGPGITHKRIIIKLYRQGYLTPEIARKTNHSEESVDRYIADFERIKTLKERRFTMEEISFLTNRGLKIIKEYFDILS